MVRPANDIAGRDGNRTATSTRRKRSALGPGGRGIFDRLFGARRVESPPASPRARKEARAIAIASGKGGTGKSFLSTSLAVLMHKARHRVTLVDCDFGLACDHLLLGVKPEHTLQDVVAGAASIQSIRTETPFGPALVPGGSGVRQMADLTDREMLALCRELGTLVRTEDVVLLDAGAGIGPQTLLTMLSAEVVVLVTQPEIAALTDAYAVIKSLTKLDGNCRFAVVMNRVQHDGDGDRAFEKLAQVSSRHVSARLDYLGEIGDDPTVTQRRLGQEPLVVSDPMGRTAMSVKRVLQNLEGFVGGFEPRVVAEDEGFEERFRSHRLFL